MQCEQDVDTQCTACINWNHKKQELKFSLAYTFGTYIYIHVYKNKIRDVTIQRNHCWEISVRSQSILHLEAIVFLQLCKIDWCKKKENW